MKPISHDKQMKTARVIVNTSLAGRSASGTVYADICFDVDDHYFPGKNWSDFAVVISSWWCGAALRLLSGKSEHEELRFMEGPLAADVFSVGDHHWRIRCIEERLARRVPQCEEDIDAVSFVKSLLDSADVLLRMCRERKWWDKDAETLQSNVDLLRQHLGER